MDAWTVALRGDEDALLAARAVLGAPTAWMSSLEVFAFEAADPATAARLLAQVVEASPGIAGAATIESTSADEARERALALALAAGAGEILLDRSSRKRLDAELLFAPAATRKGWQLPVRAVSLARPAPRRTDARDAVAHLAGSAAFVGRESETARLVALAQSGSACVVRGAPGMGGGRFIAEAAARAGKTLERLPAWALRSESLLQRALAEVRSADWIVLDPLPSAAAGWIPAALATLGEGRVLIARVESGAALLWSNPGREVSLGPLGEADARALLRSLLGEGADDALLGKLLRKAHGAPRSLVEAARAAVQLGALRRESGRWERRRPRVRRREEQPADPLAARVADLPAMLRRALGVMAALGDGARSVDASAALRGLLSNTPADLLTPLSTLALVERRAGRVYFSASLAELLVSERDKVVALAASGALEAAARAEAAVGAGRRREGSHAFAQAAHAALNAGLRAAAVRYAAAAHTQGGDVPEVSAALSAVATALAPVVQAIALAPDDRPMTRPRSLDPEALEHAAQSYEARNDPEAAARARALAELVRGNSQRAMSIAGDTSSEGSARAQLVAALAQAASGQAHRAVRTTLAALATARRNAEPSGEAAALSLLSTLYRALGREDEARGLADSARRLDRATP